MKKICPGCGRFQTDIRIIACVKCGSVYETPTIKIFTKEDIAELALALIKDWRFILLTTCIYAVIGVAGTWYLDNSSTKKLKIAKQNIEQQYTNAAIGFARQFSEYVFVSSNEVLRAYSAATNEMLEQFSVYRQQSSNKLNDAFVLFTNTLNDEVVREESYASNQMANSYSLATNQIVEEFQKDNIKQMVELVASNKAGMLLENDIKPIATAFSQEVAFMRDVSKAKAFDFKAFIKLLSIRDETNDDAAIARDIVSEIDEASATRRTERQRDYARIGEHNGNIIPGPFVSDDLAACFDMLRADANSQNREAYANEVAKLKNSTFLPMLFMLLTNETDLVAADRMVVAICSSSGKEFRLSDYYQILDWWNTNSIACKNYPTPLLRDALQNISTGNYSKAISAFVDVLNADPSADMSRALLIQCCYRVGLANLAPTFSAGFNGRMNVWSRRAEVVAELETGNVSNATVKIAHMNNRDELYVFPPYHESDLWRRVDWALFDSVTNRE